MISKTTYNYLCLLILILCLIPKFVCFTFKIADPFIYSSAAVAELSSNKGRVLLFPIENASSSSIAEHANFTSERVGVTSILVILKEVTGLKISSIVYWPINGIIIIFLGYVFGKLFFNSALLGAISASCLAWEPNINSVTNNVFLISWGLSLYLVFLNIYYKHTNNGNKAGERIKGILILFLIFITTYLTYYSTELYIIILTSLSTLIYTLLNTYYKRNKFLTYNNIALSFLVIFCTFDVAFDQYISQTKFQSFITFINYYTKRVLNGLVMKDNSSQTYLHADVNTAFVSALYYAFLILPPVIYIIYKIIKLNKYKELHYKDIFIFCIILTALASNLIYTLKGTFSLVFVLWIFPFLSIYLIDKIKLRSVTFLCLIVLFCLPIVKFALYSSDPVLGFLIKKGFETEKHIINFSNNFLPTDTIMLSDLRFAGVSMLKQSEDIGKIIMNNVPLGKDTYECIFSNDEYSARNIMDSWNYNAITLKSDWIKYPIVCSQWFYGSPLNNKFNIPFNYSFLNHVYNNGYEYLLKRR